MYEWQPDNHDLGLKFRVDYNLNWQSSELRIIKQREHDMLVGELVFKKPHEPGTEMPPTLRCRDYEQDMQNLFNALWRAGFRPPVIINVDDVTRAKDQVIKTKDEVIAAFGGHVKDLQSAFTQYLEQMKPLLEAKDNT